MARRKESPQKAAMRGYLKENDIRIKDGTDVNAVMRDMMFVLLEGVLDEELGYSKYDYRNKDTDNSRNYNSKKTKHTHYRTWRKKILSMYAKGMTTGNIESHMKELYDIGISATPSAGSQDPAHRKGIAGTSFGENLCCGIHGRHPLPRLQ